MASFDGYFREVSSELLEIYEETDGFNRKSDARDTFVERFLEETLPEKNIHVGGTIIDASGKSSNRAGIGLYDPHVPVLATDGGEHSLSAGAHAHSNRQDGSVR